jgi:cytochrome P450
VALTRSRRVHAGEVIQESTVGGYWLVSRHATVVAVSRAPEVFSSAYRGVFLTDPTSPQDLARARQLLINMDAPEHGRLLRIITPAFSPRAVRRLEAGIRAHARSVVERAVAAERFDAVHDLAAELPLLVLAELLGMPRGDRGLLYRWSNHLIGFDDPDFGGGDVDVYRRTMQEALGYASALAAARRRAPRDDVVSLMLTNEVDGQRLTREEFGQLWLLLVNAGNDTVRNLISGSLLALVAWPDQRDRLAADPHLVPRAVEELLRWVTPIMQFRRTAVCDTELDRQPIRAGDKVVLSYTSANRDEAVFPAPDRLDLGRPANPHLAFGVGAHMCLGARLARLEAAALLEALRPHLTRFELAGPPARMASNFMNGVKSMPARFAQ